ncbi:MAG: glycosyltransferase family 87 protein [Terracidiphilus sp.]|jgi:hypothetical protein
MQRSQPNGMLDFEGVYYDAQCLLQHSDPYKVGEPLRVYQSENGNLPQSSDVLRRVLIMNVYPPTAFIFTVPFAMLAWEPAYVLWIILTAGSLILAAFLMWNLAENYSPGVSILMICFVLVNSEVLFVTGNVAGIVVSLCMVAVWCFLKGRFVPVGVLCLAISLAIKPHDSGLVWLYFLLAGGVYRKRALQTLVVTIAISLPAVLWVWHVSPQWMQELRSNLLATCLKDPGVASVSSQTASMASMVINLHPAIRVFWNDPRIYNPVSYLVCGTLLLVWVVRTLRLQFSQRGAWLALAAIVPLTMLVTYHWPHDAKLLMLTVPACSMLWTEGGSIRWIALLVNSAGIMLTADIPLAIFLILTRNLHPNSATILGQIMTVVLTQPIPLILLVMGIFYLWIYLRRDPSRVATALSGESGEMPLAPTPS